jgi:hypothetical protein
LTEGYTSPVSCDPYADPQELAKHYRQMTDDQLKELANLAYSLTEPAKAGLTAELLHRNLNIPVAQAAPATPEGEDDRLITLRTFRSVQEALLAKGVLDSTGIPSVLADENIARIAGFLLGSGGREASSETD